MQYLLVGGKGDPNKEMQAPMEALFTIAYGLKFAVKKKDPKNDFKVFPLEGLWWMKGNVEFDQSAKDKWQWTLMVAQPDFVSKDLVEEVRAQRRRRRPIPSCRRSGSRNWRRASQRRYCTLGLTRTKRQTLRNCMITSLRSARGPVESITRST
ncbi:MAG TPA: hypothetical protein VMB46_05310 [Methanomassiliicoccales archaeon]|nr:hypothetical protein [Methanomassiliicoccales archaeon]